MNKYAMLILNNIYIFFCKTFFSISIINPLTLLIIPLIGSLIILAYPYDWKAEDSVVAPRYSSDSAEVAISVQDSASKTKGLTANHVPHKKKSTSDLSEVANKNSKLREPNSTSLRQSNFLNRYEERSTREMLKNKNAIIELIAISKIERQNSNLKKIAIITSLINFFISIILWIKFDSNYIGYQFITSLNLIENIEFIQLNLGVDGLSLFFVLLTTFITPIALLASHNEIEKNLRFYLVSILLLETLQIAVFVVLDLLLFYIFFESVLIPLFFIVGVWGASGAKVRAAFLLFLYTLFGSLFMLLAIIKVYSYLGATDFGLISVSEINLEYQKILWL